MPFVPWVVVIPNCSVVDWHRSVGRFLSFDLFVQSVRLFADDKLSIAFSWFRSRLEVLSKSSK